MLGLWDQRSGMQTFAQTLENIYQEWTRLLNFSLDCYLIIIKPLLCLQDLLQDMFIKQFHQMVMLSSGFSCLE